MSRPVTLIAIFTMSLVANHSLAQARQSKLVVAPSFVGPDAVESQVAADSRDWNPWRQELKTNHGLSLGFDYSAVFLSSNDVTANDTAAGGIVRAYGIVEFIGTGALVFKLEHRHKFGDPAPSAFSLAELGYVGLQERPFNDTNFRTQNLYWRQRMNGGRSTLIAGILDPTDYVDAFALASPWLHFMNFAFSTGSAAIGLPNDAAFGVAYGSMLQDNMYVIAGITDINGDPSDPFRGIDNFIGDNKYFTSVELGWTSSPRSIIVDNFHVTAWHKDRQSAAQVSGGWGLAFSLSHYVNENFMPFVRGGYANDGGSLLQKSLSIGMGYQTEAFDGMFGAGFNWGEPNDKTFAPGLEDQYAIEIFYRVPIGRRVAITGDLQYIKDPALNPSMNTAWMFNLRARASF